MATRDPDDPRCKDCGCRRPDAWALRGWWLCQRCKHGLTADERRSARGRRRRAVRMAW
jgi:hypothetical protein